MWFKRKGYFETHKYKIKFCGKYYRTYVRHNFGVWVSVYRIVERLKKNYDGVNDIDISCCGNCYESEAQRELRQFIHIISEIESGKIKKKRKTGTVKSGSFEEYIVTELI